MIESKFFNACPFEDSARLALPVEEISLTLHHSGHGEPCLLIHVVNAFMIDKPSIFALGGSQYLKQVGVPLMRLGINHLILQVAEDVPEQAWVLSEGALVPQLFEGDFRLLKRRVLFPEARGPSQGLDT